MISKTGIHSILALILMAELPQGEYAGAVQIADQVGAPRNYLGKLLKRLAQEGLVESQKGFGGGFRLARPPEQITLYDIIEPLEHVSKWNGCFLGRTKCSENDPCPVHNHWSKIRNDYLRFLKSTKIAELMDKTGMK
ncbi:MAG: Rrf2 family transcriptional regulator [candidate division Zixibacteria bacterium]|nr:Rrf2 family transcriptional regulator [candidate division Zixibacteria bacterium]